MIKWTLKEAFEKQGEKYNVIRERYDQAVVEVGTRLADLKAEKDAILQAEFRTGEARTEEKARILQLIEAAEKELATKEAERLEAHRFADSGARAERITVRDLTLDWNGPHVQGIREKELTPIIERMAAARSEYYNSLLDWIELKDTYHFEQAEIHQMTYKDNANHPGDHRSVREVTSKADLPLITESEMYYLQSGNRVLPAGVERVKGAK